MRDPSGALNAIGASALARANAHPKLVHMRMTMPALLVCVYTIASSGAVHAEPDAVLADLGVDHAVLVARLRPAFECKEDASVGSTTCTRKGVTVVVQGFVRAKSVTFIFPLNNDEQLAAGSVTMVALAQDVFPKWQYGKWYERSLMQAKRLGIKLLLRGIQISASPFGNAKDRLLVVWTTEQAQVQ